MTTVANDVVAKKFMLKIFIIKGYQKIKLLMDIVDRDGPLLNHVVDPLPE
jgi:hypothetical protein